LTTYIYFQNYPFATIVLLNCAISIIHSPNNFFTFNISKYCTDQSNIIQETIKQLVMNKFTKIEIWWHGPFSMEEINKYHADTSRSYGLYQIYGTHNISGPNTLIYIGKADQQTFAKRVGQHGWTNWEASDVQIYIGQLGGNKNIDNETWGQLIDTSERLLVNYCAPPYNTQYLNSYGNITDTIVFNFDKKNRLPSEVSTFYNDSDWWLEEGKWNIFTDVD